MISISKPGLFLYLKATTSAIGFGGKLSSSINLTYNLKFLLNYVIIFTKFRLFKIYFYIK